MAVVSWRAADHVGRIGALAVALGVGAAVVTGHGVAGVAVAEPADSSARSDDTSNDDASQTKSSSPDTGTDADPNSPPSNVSGDDVRTAPAGVVSAGGTAQIETPDEVVAPDEEDEDEEPKEEPPADDDRDDRRDRADDEDPTEATPPSPQSNTTAHTVTVAQPREADPAVPEVVLQPTVDAAPRPAEPIRKQRTVALDSEPAPQAPANVITSVLTAVLAPFANDGDVPAPADPPAAWVLAAAARREIGEALVEPQRHPPAIQTLSAQTAAVVEEAEFTGRPSLITQVFVAGLRLIKPILGAFGIELNGTSAKIPVFTDGVPPFFVTYGLNVRSGEYNGWKVWTLAPRNPSEKVVVAVHGGSFISTASLFHWSTYADLARATDATVVVPLYPLANAEGTGGTAKSVIPVMADFIAAQVAEHGAENVSVLGDSAGGSIALAAAQELVRRCESDTECDLAEALPGRMVLLAPALDSSLSNPDVAKVDDPLLSPASSKRNGLWWSRGLETAEDPDGTRNPLASPLFGSLEGLPPTTVYAGELDLRTPDVLLLQQKAITTPGADFTFELRKGQIHDWPIFGFLPDAQAERPNIYRDLGLTEAV
ncbi:alpha/beta hydrolase [Mycobacterium deserti]|uniref:Alpha/beta hydrolase n=1 Tax=Mycobacterium deserti TaxID=2978347 RepID=A0ABT2MHY7_9MYCO|nr:alpha/beta hydrolase [Mycobacterium deserti]MCT7661015.1 alpha/beta hydrolase [Mycobacterium deserti]